MVQRKTESLQAAMKFQQLLSSLGKVIERRRKALALTQVDLAKRCKIYRSYLSDLENGKRNFSLGLLEQLSLALESTPEEMLLMAAEIEQEDLEISLSLSTVHSEELL